MNLILVCLLALAAERMQGAKYEYLRAELSSQQPTVIDRMIGQIMVYCVNHLGVTPETISQVFGRPNVMGAFRDSWDYWYVRYVVTIYFRLKPDLDVRHLSPERVDGSIEPN
jgi:hypothetical protein